jgi:hypothetical protein
MTRKPFTVMDIGRQAMPNSTVAFLTQSRCVFCVTGFGFSGRIRFFDDRGWFEIKKEVPKHGKGRRTGKNHLKML